MPGVLSKTLVEINKGMKHKEGHETKNGKLLDKARKLYEKEEKWHRIE
jgi:hypothetical protein